ncbi:MAG: hypothetical protein WB795_21435, partial [Candidatus Acidiferrales bacterium]
RLAHDHHRTRPPRPGLSPSVASIRNQTRARAADMIGYLILREAAQRRAEPGDLYTAMRVVARSANK